MPFAKRFLSKKKRGRRRKKGDGGSIGNAPGQRTGGESKSGTAAAARPEAAAFRRARLTPDLRPWISHEETGTEATFRGDVLAEALKVVETKNQSQSPLDVSYEVVGQKGMPFEKTTLIYSGDLRDDQDRLSREPGVGRIRAYVPRGFCKAQIRSKGDDNNGWYPTAVETVCLNDEHRSAKAGFTSLRDTEICPPDFTTCHRG